MRLCFFLIWGASYILMSCSQEQNKPIVKATAQNLKQEVTEELKKLIVNDTIMMIDSIPLTCYRYYKSTYSDKLLWFDKATLNANGDSLWSILQKSNYFGVIPSNYHVNFIKEHLKAIHSSKAYFNVTSLIKADLLLSDAYYLLGAHLNKGRFYADSILLQTNFTKLERGWDSVLFSGYKHNSIRSAIEVLEPKFHSYHFLKKQLALILNNPNLYQFDSIPFVSQKDTAIKRQLLLKNLVQQGLYDTLSPLSDSTKLANALTNLQKKWFIQPDGKLGKYTIQALSYNRDKVIKQICMAMERWRWEQPFPERYTFINIPSFYMTVYEKDTVVMQSAIVCGKPETQTPVLKSKIDHMLIYPYWNVPISIATKEILPAVKRDTAYIRKKNFEVLGAHNTVLDYTKIPWKNYTKDYLPVRFRQRTGEENSLGVVKFNFANPYGVYLHDTNSKRYFKTSSRAQSHGCMRLEKFIQFADFLIRDDSVHYTPDSLKVYFAKQEQRRLKLRYPLPIYVSYFTAEADSLGIKLYLDIYRKDEAMMDLIYKKPN